MNRIDTIVFDLGNVILPFDPLKPCATLGEMIGKSAEEVAHLIYDSNLERRFEQGRIDGAAFTRGVSEALDLNLAESEFRELWADMFTENQEVSDIVRELKPYHRLMLMSNTNHWHWRHAFLHFPIVSEFESYVLSFEVGELKPHPAIYRAALAKAGADRSVLFIDDIEVNVNAARIMGIAGIHFCSAKQLRRELIALGCKL
ncbi:MAG: HAD family phosphatase [Candidatus Zixiibacteriota bacterium]